MTRDEERNEAWLYLEQNLGERELEIAIDTAAYAASRRFAGFVTKDDVAQTLWEWVSKAPIKIARWHGENTQEGFNRVFASVLYDEASYLGRHAKAEALGYKLGDEFYYTRRMLTELLGSVYDYEKWINPEKPKDTGRVMNGKPINEGFDWVASLADMSRGIARIPKDYQRVLYMTYGLGLNRQELADKWGVSLSTVSSRHTAALKRLWRELGGPRWLSTAEDRAPDDRDYWPSGRQAMSNAQARALTDSEAAMERRPRRED